MRTRTLGLAVLSLLTSFATPPAFAAPEHPEHPWCGTRPGLLQEKIAVHQAEQRRRERDPMARFEAAQAGEVEAAQVGQIAVVSDPAILLQPKQLDLEGLGLRFTPVKKGVQVARLESALDPDLGERLPLGDDDTRLVPFFKGFRFPFHKKRYTGFFVNSDGNVTFASGDGRSVERSLSNFAALPRIAPLYVDLDPTQASGEGGVYVRTAKDRVVVTWLAVPEFFAGPGTPPGPNTVQLTLLKNGTITFAFGDLATTQAVVGAGPGPAAALALIDYTQETPTAPIAGAIAERFSPDAELDDLAIAKAFYRGFQDVYDNLVVFLDFNFFLQGGQAFAYQFQTKNEVGGIGLQVFDDSAAGGSKGKLRSFAQMGFASRYPLDPDVPTLGTDSGLDVLAHETGHRWLSFIAFPDPGGDAAVLRGRQRAHWSYMFNSEASHLEGMRLAPQPDGSFLAVGASERYSELDLYLMGLLPPNAVPFNQHFYVAGTNADREARPQVGAVLRGQRVNVNVEQIVAANGPRTPAAGNGRGAAQKSFNMAFVLVTMPGEAPTPQNLAIVEAYRTAWESYFPEATGGLGSVNTNLVPRRGRRR